MGLVRLGGVSVAGVKGRKRGRLEWEAVNSETGGYKETST